jgi:pimeloyl-ACP methyl ester carboxylesterase
MVAESFGGCLALRVASAAPHLFDRLVLVNPATSFSRALAGLPGIIASTNLLSLFPEPLYQVPLLFIPSLVVKEAECDLKRSLPRRGSCSCIARKMKRSNCAAIGVLIECQAVALCRRHRLCSYLFWWTRTMLASLE